MAVLWSIALLSALAMAASTSFRSFAGIMVVDRDRVIADALLTAGLEAGAGSLMTSRGRPLSEREITLTLSTGSVRVRFSDEGGRIDLNTAPSEVLASLFRLVGAKDGSAIAERIVARRKRNEAAGSKDDSDSSPQSPQGPDWTSPFTDVRQVARVGGVSPDWVGAIIPLTTVFGTETVNPMTASADVLAALPGLGRERIKSILEIRSRFPTEPARLQGLLEPAKRYLAVKPQQVVSVYVTAKLVDGFTAAAHAVIVLLPDDSQPYRVLVWNPLSTESMLAGS